MPQLVLCVIVLALCGCKTRVEGLSFGSNDGSTDGATRDAMIAAGAEPNDVDRILNTEGIIYTDQCGLNSDQCAPGNLDFCYDNSYAVGSTLRQKPKEFYTQFCPPPPPPPPPPPTKKPPNNSCPYAHDGECDEPMYCGDGTDCSDCGNCATQEVDDTCRYALDGECDEPGYCALGTDCTDCDYCGGHRRLSEERVALKMDDEAGAEPEAEPVAEPEAEPPAAPEPPTVPEQDVYIMRLLKEQLDLRVAAEKAKYARLVTKLTGICDATQAVYELTSPNRRDEERWLREHYDTLSDVNIENTPLEELCKIEPEVENTAYYHMRVLEDFFSDELFNEVQAAAPKPAMKMDDEDAAAPPAAAAVPAAEPEPEAEAEPVTVVMAEPAVVAELATQVVTGDFQTFQLLPSRIEQLPTERQQQLEEKQEEMRELQQNLMTSRSPNLIRSYMVTHADLCMEIQRLSVPPTAITRDDAPRHLCCPILHVLMEDP
eukprot:SAG11_NODE_1146_length_5684_cov_59.423277_7_plen_486_part_01